MEPEPLCVSELLAAFSLDILDEDDRQRVGNAITQCPELEAELADFRAAASAIAYSAPSQAIAPDLKDRLFEKIGVEPPTAEPPSTPSAHLFIRSEERVWQPHPFVPRVTIARLFVDRARRELTCLLRAEAGVTYPYHRHAAIEEIFMLEGDLEVEGQVYHGGDYLRSSPGSTHAPYTQGGCMFFVRTSIDDEYPS
jgi:anti-sigma factor ChrR (cupin superfamily)